MAADPVALVANSATTTTQAKNAAVDLTGTVAAAGRTVDVTGTGVIDFAGNAFRLNLNAPPAGQIEERLVGGLVYVKVPPSATAEVGGKPWLEIDPKAVTGGSSNPFANLNSSNPSQLLGTLRGVGTVTRVGDETIGGAHTTHYRADIDLNKAAEQQHLSPQLRQQLQQSFGGSPTLPEDVWIDDAGLVRRVAVVIDAQPAPNGGTPTPVHGRVQMDLHDFGQAPGGITAPPADQVTDISRMLSGLGSAGTATPS